MNIRHAPLAAIVLLGALATATAGAQRPTTDQGPSLLRPSLSGMENFMSYCAPCHGGDGKGRGPVAGALTSLPADLTTLAARNKGVFPAARVRDFVTNGDPAIRAHGSRTMPVWGPTFRALSSSDKTVAIRIANVVTYLESIQQ